MPGFNKNRVRKNHIKIAFLYRNKSEIKFSKKNQYPQYLFGYVTDDNQIFYDEFVVRNVKRFNRGTILSFIKKVIRKRYIDERTSVVYYFGKSRYKSTDVMYMLWHIYQHGLKFTMRRINLGTIVLRYNTIFKLKFLRHAKIPAVKMGFGKAMDFINTIYLTVLENRICPWIDNEFTEKLSRIRPNRAKMYKVVSLTLFYLCLMKYYTLRGAKNLVKNKIIHGVDIILDEPTTKGLGIRKQWQK